MEMQTLNIKDAEYPERLGAIFDPPENLYYWGNLDVLKRKCVAIVGTRMATAYGETQAFNMAKELGANGLCVVSGLAFGIDAAAHKGALAGGGATIAVVAQDLPNLRPASNYRLAMEIVEKGGLLISEHGRATPILKLEYLNRNRIISGISEGVLVVEAPMRSGALNTARHALDQGREVMGIPGRVSDECSKGVNEMLKNGAHVICSAKDVAAILKVDWESEKKIRLKGLPKEVFLCLQKGPRNSSELCEEFVPSKLYAALSELESDGLVTASGSGLFSVTRSTSVMVVTP
ncbi:DNA-protecting protein DprA [Candidatus Peregrinibacteria bacterium]|nr:DNA-protecting protein DprA [Candidatus Peregrinibacteria bacterium]